MCQSSFFDGRVTILTFSWTLDRHINYASDSDRNSDSDSVIDSDSDSDSDSEMYSGKFILDNEQWANWIWTMDHDP